MSVTSKLLKAAALTQMYAIGFEIPYVDNSWNPPTNPHLAKWADFKMPPKKYLNYLELLRKDALRRGLPFKIPEEMTEWKMNHRHGKNKKAV